MSSTRLRIKELLRERRWTTKVLAEKTGMSESYLTHIKNATRRWNEDALRKLSEAFEIDPIELFAYKNSGIRTFNVEEQLGATQVLSDKQTLDSDMKLKVVPVVSEILTSGNDCSMVQPTRFVPFCGLEDDSMFCYEVPDNEMSPKFVKGDLLVISPSIWTKSGDFVAVEFGNKDVIRKIMQVNFMDDFVVLESVNHKSSPVALVRGKDNFKIIGKVVCRYQNY